MSDEYSLRYFEIQCSRKLINEAVSMYASATNSCVNSPCSHLCLPKSTFPHFSCLCPDDDLQFQYSLNDKNVTCLVTRIVPGKKQDPFS
jgi:hypothetical protein